MPAYTFVEEPAQCVDWIDRQERIAVDTEFMREKTFFAQLCLVQLGSAEGIFCVDPLAGHSTDAFWASLHARPWVVHSARQDIEVIYQAAGSMPGELFDTQIAAALLGFQPQIGYAGLVKELFDVELPKSHTRANWSRRPLPDEYLDYAAEDVEYLLPACDILTERLAQKGRLEWAHYDSALLLDPALYEIDPANAVQRLKGARNFAGSRRAAAAQLAKWRETEALQRNLPRQWIIKDTVLTDIAYKLPSSMDELVKIDGLPAKVAERAGNDILQAVRAGKADSGNGYRPPGRPDEAQKILLQKMQKLVGDCAAELDLPAETIASKKELAGLLDGERSDSRVFNGWRDELVGKRLAELL